MYEEDSPAQLSFEYVGTLVHIGCKPWIPADGSMLHKTHAGCYMSLPMNDSPRSRAVLLYTCLYQSEVRVGAPNVHSISI